VIDETGWDGRREERRLRERAGRYLAVGGARGAGEFMSFLIFVHAHFMR
jgi:hypothetical protein